MIYSPLPLNYSLLPRKEYEDVPEKQKFSDELQNKVQFAIFPKDNDKEIHYRLDQSQLIDMLGNQGPDVPYYWMEFFYAKTGHRRCERPYKVREKVEACINYAGKIRWYRGKIRYINYDKVKVTDKTAQAF